MGCSRSTIADHQRVEYLITSRRVADSLDAQAERRLLRSDHLREPNTCRSSQDRDVIAQLRYCIIA